MKTSMTLGDWLLGSMPLISVLLLCCSIVVEADGGDGLAVFLAIPIGWAIVLLVKAIE